ncbi:MAG: NAD-dependent epimerase/dehydratase family protein, partial [Dehalococcoidia bacterium]
LIRKCIEARDAGARQIEVWGTGAATREFLYVEDAAAGIAQAAELYDDPEPVNLGSGFEISIRDLVALIAELTNFKGELVWNSGEPDGQPRRRLDVSRAAQRFDFTAKIGFQEGLKRTITWYEAQSPTQKSSTTREGNSPALTEMVTSSPQPLNSDNSS